MYIYIYIKYKPTNPLAGNPKWSWHVVHIGHICSHVFSIPGLVSTIVSHIPSASCYPKGSRARRCRSPSSCNGGSSGKLWATSDILLTHPCPSFTPYISVGHFLWMVVIGQCWLFVFLSISSISSILSIITISIIIMMTMSIWSTCWTLMPSCCHPLKLPAMTSTKSSKPGFIPGITFHLRSWQHVKLHVTSRNYRKSTLSLYCLIFFVYISISLSIYLSNLI